jgi:hypothetical protein
VTVHVILGVDHLVAPSVMIFFMSCTAPIEEDEGVAEASSSSCCALDSMALFIVCLRVRNDLTTWC